MADTGEEWSGDPSLEVGLGQGKVAESGEEVREPSLEVGQGQGKVAESGGEVREPSLEVGQRVSEAGLGQGRGYDRPE